MALPTSLASCPVSVPSPAGHITLPSLFSPKDLCTGCSFSWASLPWGPQLAPPLRVFPDCPSPARSPLTLQSPVSTDNISYGLHCLSRTVDGCLSVLYTGHLDQCPAHRRGSIKHRWKGGREPPKHGSGQTRGLQKRPDRDP